MRRFSQRNSLVTLNEINITPLLDLAFVLLIIFVITRPLLEQNINLNLPDGKGTPDNRSIDRNNIKMVEITPSGQYYLNGRSFSLSQIEQALREAFRTNPKLIVDIRADKSSSWNNVSAILDICQRNHITQIVPHTAPAEHR